MTVRRLLLLLQMHHLFIHVDDALHHVLVVTARSSTLARHLVGLTRGKLIAARTTLTDQIETLTEKTLPNNMTHECYHSLFESNEDNYTYYRLRILQTDKRV